ncbi:dihydroorotase [Ignicoccus hospitalis KIN4/I]|uniref:Dihydroorotase n=1 Tax=Ignicoccus hospitalis (strain KIN4/I / DSM 18386 / JCM 14125) TaxID=453591 RepID=A8AA26_IGNH4|nr:dihydroorotase [Ignicoccus hospitalis KIN4/I]
MVEATLISEGERLAVRGPSAACDCETCLEMRGTIALPGMVDAHVHTRGLMLSHKEDPLTASRAALKGGVVAIADMPNTLPKINNLEILKKRLEEFKRTCLVDCYQYAGVPESPEELRAMSKHVVGVKVYPEDYPNLHVLRNYDGLIVVHPEHPAFVKESPDPGERGLSRSPFAEPAAMELFRGFSKVHFTHVSTPEGARKAEEMGFTFDVTPHHILLNNEVEKLKGCVAKVNPPLRDEPRRGMMFDIFVNKDVMMVTDHAPHAVWEKELPFYDCPPGFPGLETALPLLLTLYKRGIISLNKVVRSYSELPAKLLGLWPDLGRLETGSLASFTVVDVNERRRVEPWEFESKAKYSPFEGMNLWGEVVATVVRGKIRYFSGNFYY